MAYPKRVLLIDDDEDDCDIFNSAINELESGIDFFYDCDSEKALKRLSSEQLPVPDLLFLDWNMPKLTGMQYLTAIRKFPCFDNVPVIIYTTSTAQKDREEAGRLGASYFISKPSSFKELKQLLQHIFALTWQ
jgi:CheY-like chemotaxis protein